MERGGGGLEDILRPAEGGRMLNEIILKEQKRGFLSAYADPLYVVRGRKTVSK
jgi:hypothetical protein